MSKKVRNPHAAKTSSLQKFGEKPHDFEFVTLRLLSIKLLRANGSRLI
jgi:hypothetical protein